MSATIHQAMRDSTNNAFSAEDRRSYAVAAALEVIIAKAASAEGNSIHRELENLSGYADKIQEALKVK